MKARATQSTLSRATATAALACALLGASTAALAAGGNVTGISVNPNSVSVNDIVTLKVNITGGSYGVACNMSWAVLDAGNMQVKGGAPSVQSDANSADYTVQFGIAAPGVYTVQATSGAPSGQNVSCVGMVKTTLTVKAKAPVMTLSPVSSPIYKTNPIPVNPGNPGAVRKP